MIDLFGALVVANYIASMPAQFQRRLTTSPGIGALQAYDPTCDAIIEDGWSVAFDNAKSYPQTPSVSELRNGLLPEINAEYNAQQQNDWYYCVQLNLTTASGKGGSGASCF